MLLEVELDMGPLFLYDFQDLGQRQNSSVYDQLCGSSDLDSFKCYLGLDISKN